MTSVRNAISFPPCTGRRKCACTAWSRLSDGASRHAALIVRARPIPPKTTGPYQSGVRPTQESPCRSCRSRARNSSIAACCCSARSVTSPTTELRRTLLHDRPDGLLAVLGVEARERVADLLDGASFDVADQRCPSDETLRPPNRERCLRGDGGAA